MDRPEAHHTIPIYLCGSAAQITSTIRWADHKAIHWGLGRIAVGIIGAEAAADMMVPLGMRRKEPIMRFAYSEYGRGVIANMIEEFYEESGYASVGVPIIRAAFGAEKKYYVSGAKTSIPACIRP